MRFPGTAASTLLLAAALLSGCGDANRLDDGEFTRQVGVVATGATEGSLLARTVDRGSSPTQTTRVRAKELAASIQDASTQFDEMRIPPHLRARVQAADAISTQAATLLDELVRHPDRATARDVGRQLRALGDRADKLQVRA